MDEGRMDGRGISEEHSKGGAKNNNEENEEMKGGNGSLFIFYGSTMVWDGAAKDLSIERQKMTNGRSG